MNRDEASSRVILVDGQDRPRGTADKLGAHRLGLLHRAFSIFILNDAGEMLLQKRAAGKYHSGGLWTNACCSHPRPDDSRAPEQEAADRLREEMGFSTGLRHLTAFLYSADVANDLREHEFDHIYFGVYSGAVHPNPNEASAYKWLPVTAVAEWLQAEPHLFTAWFAKAFELFQDHLPQAGTAS